MIIWPLIGMFLARDLIDSPMECVFPFGGLTLLLMLPIFAGFTSNVPAIFIAPVIFVTWLLVLVLPVIGIHRRGWKPKDIRIPQSLFSLAQAIMGTLFLFGKMI